MCGDLEASTLDRELDMNGTSFAEAAKAAGYGGRDHKASSHGLIDPQALSALSQDLLRVPCTHALQARQVAITRMPTAWPPVTLQSHKLHGLSQLGLGALSLKAVQGAEALAFAVAEAVPGLCRAAH